MLAPLSPLEAAEIEYATHPTAATERAWLDARKAADLAEAKSRGLSHKAAADAQRAKEKAIEAKRKRLSACVKSARALAPELASFVAFFASSHVEGARRVDAMHRAIDAHNRTVREAQQLARELGVSMEVADEAHAWNASVGAGRAQRAALLAAGLRGVSDYWHEAHE